MATVEKWTPFGVAMNITATAGTVTRTSATQFTVQINASWEVSYSGNKTNYGMTASSGGGSVTLNPFGTKTGSGSGSFTGTYSISGGAAQTKSISVTFRNFNNDNGDSSAYNVNLSVSVPAATYTVKYSINGGNSGSMPASTVTYGTAFMTRQNTFKKTGYTFDGWNEKADGTGTKWGITSSDDGTYESGKSWTWTYDKDITLYAQWKENTMTVNYCGNGADYGTYQGQSVNLNDVVHTDVFYYDNSYTTGLSNVQNKDYLYLSRTGYSPTHYWLTAGDNYISVHEDDTSLNSGEAVANAFGLTLANSNQAVRVHAAWIKNTYTFNFVANGGSGNMDAQLVNWEDTFQLSKNLFKREGYTFIGWNVCRDDGKWYVNYNGWLTEDEIAAGGYEKKMYDNQVELNLNESWISDNEDARTFTMYALWEISGVVYIDNGTLFEPYLTYIDNGTDWDLYLAYVDNGTNWNIIS